MKIYLFLVDKVLNFALPKEIAGSFSFDENEKEEDKLINVEARNAAWVLYSTEESKILQNGSYVPSLVLQENNFYNLERNNQKYLIHTVPLLETSIVPFSYDKNIDLIVGNQEGCNVLYNLPFVKGIAFRIHYSGEEIVLEKGMMPIYVNGRVVNDSAIVLHMGDTVNIYGLKVILLTGLVLINKVGELVTVNEMAAKIQRYTIAPSQPVKDADMKDLDLYGKDDYFSKSPRIRRVIETRELKISPPPGQQEQREMPWILTVGPMLTMGLMSFVTFMNTFSKIMNHETTLGKSWTQLMSAIVMLVSSLVWPSITKHYNKKQKEKETKELKEKYDAYLHEQEEELMKEVKLQQEIILENMISLEECIKIIQNRTLKLWDKRIDQNDFLMVRVGIGNEKLDVKVNFPEEGFSMDKSDALKKLEKMQKDYEYITNVPIGYSLYENKVTAIMGMPEKSYYFTNNIILQLLAFYSYEDLKLVVFTNEKNKKNWDYIKFLNHNFTNDRSFRFFASNADSGKEVADYLDFEMNRHMQTKGEHPVPPYYLIIVDDYEMVKRYNFIKKLTEEDDNYGFSMLILENRMSRLPSKCNNFITLGDRVSGILKNSYENQEQISFVDEVKYNIDMMNIARVLSNIPIEFEEALGTLPESITFLEMEKVGKVEQLNILNRWNTNDSTTSLKAEIGVNEQGDWMYLDLHEKFHGPHGLVAGMTGSGKSEFIITYLLSMAINYSPDDVAFILIDYKGGGLAFAFENKITGVCLPHLAGTITNLDKAEMDRTLVSIDSEVKRRQQKFNEARDRLGESTIDIYKYQRFYHEGKIDEPIPHLLIVCDEFAELKSQQPDFMDNLISIARIGRSLGVHLILATQKPSGVVNDQIWSNSKFHICLKVQDASDSKEMLKRPDAANLKQAGRFYLQVGYDEYFALGQSAWCGAKYFPSDKIVKQVDKSINFINDNGFHIKNIQYSTGAGKQEAKGEQIAAIMQEIIATAKMTNKYAKRLWLENIPEIILVDDLYKKYGSVLKHDTVRSIIGEYDAPEKQEQGLLTYEFIEEGNTAIYSTDGSEYEKLLCTIVYSTIVEYSPEEVQFYIIDFGAQSLRKFEKAPHVGGIVYMGEDEKYNNYFKLLKKELETRKKILSDFGGDYKTYVKQGNKMPVMVAMMNNYDAMSDNDSKIYDFLPELVRDSERYGAVFIFTATGSSSISRKLSQNLNNFYALKLKDPGDYQYIFNSRKRIVPRNIFGRGLYSDGETLHEFQTASIVEDDAKTTEFVRSKAEELNAKYQVKAPRIPELPEQVLFEHVASAITDVTKVPIGINQNTLAIDKYDFTISPGTTITSNKLKNMTSFMGGLLEVIHHIPDTDTIVLDPFKFQDAKQEWITQYVTENFDNFFDQMLPNLQTKIEQENNHYTFIVLYGIEKILSGLSDKSKLEKLMELAKKTGKIFVLLLDDVGKLKPYAYERWFQGYFLASDGIFVGKGVSDQNVVKISAYNAMLTRNYPNNMGFHVKESDYRLVKLLEFDKVEEEEEE